METCDKLPYARSEASGFANPTGGFVLIWVVLTMTALAWIAVLVLRSATEGLKTEATDLVLLRADAALDASFANLSDRLMAQAAETLLVPSTGELESGGAHVRWTLTREAEKVDLNKASTTALARVFKRAGVTDMKASQLADATIDWRDPDDLKSLNGAEATDYASAGLPQPANRPFETLSELRLVLGMDEANFDCLEDGVTLWGGQVDAASGLGLDDASTQGQPVQAGDVIRLSTEIRDAGNRNVRTQARILRVTGKPQEPAWTLAIVGDTSVGQFGSTAGCRR